MDKKTPTPKTYIESAKIEEIIKKTFGVPRNIFFLDRKYVVLTKDELSDKLKNSKVNEQRYVPEEHDCDDFSIALMNEFREYAFGMVLLKTKLTNQFHAVNIQIDAEKEVAVLIEPQTDQVFTDVSQIHLVLI